MQSPTRLPDARSGETSRSGTSSRFLPIFTLAAPFVLGWGLLFVLGCGGPPLPPPTPKKPLAEVTLTIACDDAAFRRDLANRVLGWSSKSGATVRVFPSSEAKSPDILIRTPAELGALAATGELASIPAELRATGNALQWVRILPAYSTLLTQWKKDIVGLPLAGDGFVLVYRADRFAEDATRTRFRAKLGHDLAPPTTWDELAELAGFFTEIDQKPSLAPLPTDPTRLLTQFHQIAVCSDRKSYTESDLTQGGGATGSRAVNADTMSFHFDLRTGKPRIAGPAFVLAAEWLAKTRPYRATAGTDDPIAAMANGSAIAAVVSLADLSRLPRDESTNAVSKRFGVSRLPGSRTLFDANGKPVTAAGSPNYIPFLGTTTRIAGVVKSCPQPGAAWDLLAELASVTGSLAVMGDPALGAGPFRSEQREEARGAVWLAYCFDEEGTRQLVQAMQGFFPPEVGNPAVVLRTPNQGALMVSLEKQVRRVALGEAPANVALRQAADEWQAAAAAAANPTVFIAWLQASVGLQESLVPAN